MSLSALGMACKNVAQTIEFYKYLGLEFKQCGEEHFESELASGMRLMLDSYKLLKEINPNWVEPAHPGISLCFEQSSPSSVDQVYNELISSGYRGIKSPWDAFWGQRYASVLDPDGNQVDIFAALS